MGDTSADLIDLSSIDQLSFNQPTTLMDSVVASSTASTAAAATASDRHPHVCDSVRSIIKPQTPVPTFGHVQDDSGGNGGVGSECFTSRRTRERIDEFETQLECFIKTKRLLLEQFAEETNNLIQKHDREILGLRQKHLVCENNFKSQLENAVQKIKILEAKIETEQNSVKVKIELYEEQIVRLRQDAATTKEKLEFSIRDKEKLNDELKKTNLNLESQLKLLNSEFKNRRQQMEDRLREYEINQERDLQELKKLRDDYGVALKEISGLQHELTEVRENLGKKETEYSALMQELEQHRNKIQVEEEIKRKSADKLQLMSENLKVNQNENENLRKKLTEVQNKMTEEITKLRNKINSQQSNFEQRYETLAREKSDTEEKLKSEMAEMEKRLLESRRQCDQLKNELQKTCEEKDKLKHQLEKEMTKLMSEKESLEQAYHLNRADLNNRITDLEQKLKDMTEKYETARNESQKAQSYISTLENDLKTKNAEILNVHEKFNLQEMDRLSLFNELENVKRLLQIETVEKKEKIRQIEELNESLSSSQIEIEKLKDVNEQLKRSIEEGDKLRLSLLKDCNELRETLGEVEKSRLEIKSKLNSCQYNCASLNNQLKKRGLELDDLRRKLNSYNEEKKFWQQDLDATSQSLTQMKTAYERLHQQNVLLQNKLSQMETEASSRQSENGSGKVASSPADKESIRKLTRECEQSRDRIARLETEKKHFERLYISLEREYQTLKSSFNVPPTSSASAYNLLNVDRSPSPTVGQQRKPSDHSSSLLSLTQLLKNDFTTMNPYAVMTLDDTSRSLEILRQKNNELKQKVLGRQNTPNHQDSVGTAKRMVAMKNSSSDCCGCNHHHQNSQEQDFPPASTENFFYDLNEHLIFDENKNVEHVGDQADSSFDEKLKQAEMNAQKVLQSCEPEIKKFSVRSTRIKSAATHHQKMNGGTTIQTNGGGGMTEKS